MFKEIKNLKLVAVCLAVIVLSVVGAWGIRTIIAAWTGPTGSPGVAQPPGPVLLQATTPGTPQTGNINVSGTIKAGTLCIGGDCIPPWPTGGGSQNLLSVLNAGADASTFTGVTAVGGDLNLGGNIIVAGGGINNFSSDVNIGGNVTIGNSITSNQLCLNGDCRDSWPGATGGGVTSHTTCTGGSCVWVSGAGTNGCTVNSDCTGGGAPTGKRLVFVTSQSWDGNLGGLAGADTKCQTAAANAGRTTEGVIFRAWLSSESESAASRLYNSAKVDYPFYLVDGTTRVADNWLHLLSVGSGTSVLLNKINKTEFGALLDVVSCWTGTGYPNGVSLSGGNCVNWTSNAAYANRYGVLGSNRYTDGWWTAAVTYYDTSFSMCSFGRRLYCIEY